MDTQNVTLSIPKKILRKAKILAIQRNISLSSMMTRALEDLVAHEEAYSTARSRNLKQLKNGFDLGTGGQVSWTRDELHER
ncbi:MAG: hypothetical protein JXA78_07170 [Anaerolineales bacterium]|nr:hypothetical protein [Anaerolineales bacterium]